MKTMTKLAAAGAVALAIAGFSRVPEFGGTIEAGQSETWTTEVHSGLVSVEIDGAGFGDLDLIVYDADGRIIVQDESLGNDPQVQFWNERGRTLTFKVVNAHDRFASSYHGHVR